MLDRIVATTRETLPQLRGRRAALEEAAARARPARPFADALRAPGLSIIAEIKRRSPSAGPIAPALDPVALAQAYVRGGAAAISVLTDREYFGGNLDDLAAVSALVAAPVLRKDFIIDEAQVVEARAAGADAVLLIVAILPGGLLSDLLAAVRVHGLGALVEAHDGGEIERAVEAGAQVIGINNRDLESFEVDTDTAIRLRDAIPPQIVAVAESGIRSHADAAGVYEAGFDAVLVGQAAAQAPDPTAFVESLRVGT